MEPKQFTQINTDYYKTLSKQRIEKNFLILILIQDICKSYDNNIDNGEILNTFSLILGMEQGCLILPLISHTVLEVLLSSINKEKQNI